MKKKKIIKISLLVSVLCFLLVFIICVFSNYDIYRKVIFLPIQRTQVLTKVDEAINSKHLKLLLKQWASESKKTDNLQAGITPENDLGKVLLAEQSKADIKLFDMINIPCFMVRREQFDRSKKEIAKDFVELLAAKADFYPWHELLSINDRRYNDSDLKLTVSFDKNSESVQILMLMYCIEMNDSGDIVFIKKPASTISFGRADPADNYVGSVFLKEPPRIAWKRTDNPFDSYSGYYGVRLICKWKDFHEEYLFVYHTGGPNQ